MAPQNLATFTTGIKLPELAPCAAPSLSLTEAEYPGLRVCSAPWENKSLRFTMHLSFWLSIAKSTLHFTEPNCLQFLGVLRWSPAPPRHPEPLSIKPLVQSPVHILLNARKYSSAMRNVFGPDKEPMECPIANISPKEVEGREGSQQRTDLPLGGSACERSNEAPFMTAHPSIQTSPSIRQTTPLTSKQSEWREREGRESPSLPPSPATMPRSDDAV